MDTRTRLIVFECKAAGEAEFISYWSSLYRYSLESLYESNIGKPLTKSRILELFLWKNGGPIAAKKLKSIKRNYIAQKSKPPAPSATRDEIFRFICEPGGVIWRIFWLHCQRPTHFPIFDQHVYRAMLHLQTQNISEIPDSERERAQFYVDEYRQFHASFQSPKNRDLDKALWAYGKYLSRYTI